MPHRTATALIILGAVLARLVFATELPLSGDEAYHWEWSRRLAASYYDHPGLSAWLIALAGLIVPADSELAVRLPAILCLAGTAWVSAAFARRIAVSLGEAPEVVARAGVVAAALLTVTPVFAVFAVYMSTDPPFLLCSTATWYLTLVALEDDRWRAWLGAGVAMGLAASAKFLAFTIPLAAGVLLVMHRPYRRHLRNPRAWAGAATAVAVFSPVLVWNATHDWATFRFNFGIRQQDNDATLLHPLAYLGGQALGLLPVLCVVAVGQGARAWTRWRTSAHGPSLLCLAAAAPLVVFGVVSTVREVGLHWPVSGWIPLLVLVAVAAARATLAARWVRRTLLWTAVPVVVLHFVALIPPRWLDDAPRDQRNTPPHIAVQRMNERFGWRELGQAVAKVREEMGGDSRVFVAGASYGIAAAVAFYLPDQGRAWLWAPVRNHGENYRYWDRFGELAGQDAVFVAKRASQGVDALPELRRRFGQVSPAEAVPILVDGVRVRTFYLYRCRAFDGVAPYQR